MDSLIKIGASVNIKRTDGKYISLCISSYVIDAKVQFHTHSVSVLSSSMPNIPIGFDSHLLFVCAPHSNHFNGNGFPLCLMRMSDSSVGVDKWNWFALFRSHWHCVYALAHIRFKWAYFLFGIIATATTPNGISNGFEQSLLFNNRFTHAYIHRPAQQFTIWQQ